MKGDIALTKDGHAAQYDGWEGPRRSNATAAESLLDNVTVVEGLKHNLIDYDTRGGRILSLQQYPLSPPCAEGSGALERALVAPRPHDIGDKTITHRNAISRVRPGMESA